MARQRMLAVTEQRAVTPQLRWLTCHAPDLARDVRPGQFVMLRCSDPSVFDPLLRRPMFVAAVEPALGQIAFLYTPDHDGGLRWLAHAQPGDQLDCYGPLGKPFVLGQRTRALLLLGSGPAIPALLMLARELLARGGSATLIAAAAERQLLPPPALLPADLEYQGLVGEAALAEALGQEGGTAALRWADQIALALPPDQLLPIRRQIQAVRLRTERGLVATLLAAPFPCGTGICGACSIEARHGRRLACSDGPVFDLRDLLESV